MIRATARKVEVRGWTTEARRVADMLSRAPSMNTTMTRCDLKSLLLESGGQIMSQGRLLDIKSKHLGAGVYRVSVVGRG